MKKNNKGFTLAELLIVVAIIAVLVAISIPIFSTQLEKSREATDIANIRSAYAEVVTGYLADNNSSSKITVNLQQAVDSWQTSPAPVLTVQTGNYEQSQFSLSQPKAKGTASVGISITTSADAIPVIEMK